MSYFDDRELDERDQPISKRYYDSLRHALNEHRARIIAHTLDDAERAKAKTDMAQIEEYLAYKEDHDLVEFNTDLDSQD